MLVTNSILFNLQTRSIDFTLPFPYVDADVTIYMELPFGFRAPSDGDNVLLLIKNLYGLKHAAKTFYEYLVDILVNEVEFTLSMVVGRVGGQSFLYCGLHSDYVSERN